jgi:hypothetical protein
MFRQKRPCKDRESAGGTAVKVDVALADSGITQIARRAFASSGGRFLGFYDR